MTNSRDKGKRGEREAVSLWSRWFPHAKRGLQYRSGVDAPDVDSTPYWVEVKYYAKLSPAVIANAWNQGMAAMERAVEEECLPDLTDVVVMYRQTTGAERGWFVVAECQLLRDLGYNGQNGKFQHKNLVGDVDLRRITWIEWQGLIDQHFPVQTDIEEVV